MTKRETIRRLKHIIISQGEQEDYDAIATAIEAIEDRASEKCGKWEYHTENIRGHLTLWWGCSCCHRESPGVLCEGELPNFCGNCGAKMTKIRDENGRDKKRTLALWDYKKGEWITLN